MVDGRAPHGARGLKQQPRKIHGASRGRAPHGARGLKHQSATDVPSAEVAPRMGRVD